MRQPVLRFAPSPNGRLHVGHAYSALLNASVARANHGRFLLRIEDIDTVRCRPELEQAVYDDLAWLGLAWELPVRRQSEHFGDYGQAFGHLRNLGLVYPCFCSRRDIVRAIAACGKAGTDPDGAPLYPGTCRCLSERERERRIGNGADHAWRLDMEKAMSLTGGELTFRFFDIDKGTFIIGAEQLQVCKPDQWGDPVVVRKETSTSYHLSVVVDDALQGVTHVVRGRDLESATDLHVLLQGLLGLPTPVYHHHALIRSGEGEKLSKSLSSESLADLRAGGRMPEDIRRMLGFS